MSETWCPLALKVGGRTLFLLWVSDDWARNRVLPDAGRVVSFSDEQSAREYALAENLTPAPEEDLGLHDLDSAVSWLEADTEPDRRLLLAIWNLAGDVARKRQRAVRHQIAVDLIRSRVVASTSRSGPT